MHEQELYNILESHKKWLASNGGKQANLTGADLTDADLSNADLTDADLSNANLTGADLTGANLTAADLSNVNLRGANLTGADLDGADLRNANLYFADLRDTILTGAGLRNVTLTGAKNILRIYVPGMSTRQDELYAVKHSRTIMIKAGCWWGTIDEFEEVVIEKDREKYIAAVAFIWEVMN